MIDCRSFAGFSSRLILLAIPWSTVSTAAAGEGYLGPIDVVATPDQKHLFLACSDAAEVAQLEIASHQIIRRIALPGRPTGLGLCPAGRRLFVTMAGPSSQVAVIDTQTGAITASITAGHTAMSPVVSPDGTKLYVCNRFDHDVSLIDLEHGRCIKRIAVTREPVAADLTPDGKYLVVANHLPAGAADENSIAAEVTIVDTGQHQTHEIQLPNGSTSLRDVYVSPDGAYAYVTLILARYQLPTTQLERGWMNTNALGVVDLRNRTLLNTVLLDTINLGAANPWGVSGTDDGAFLCVTHAGTHEVSVIDQIALLKKLHRAAEDRADPARTYGGVPNDLAFMAGLRRRLRLAGNGPRGLVVVGSRVYAAEYFSDSLGVLDIKPDMHANARSIDLGGSKTLDEIRKGAMLFHDASMCFQHWQSCASCHPDARADTLNWDLLNDDIGNPKNTKSMLLSHETPPAMATGVRGGAEEAVRAGIRSIQFVYRPEEDARAIDAYLKSVQPSPSPYLKDGKLTASAERGKQLFFTDRVGCSRCHSGSHYTDLRQYDVGTHVPFDFKTDAQDARVPQKSLDTPTLIEVWRTGPYLHDGRAVTIDEVLTTYNQKDAHGVTSQLNNQQIRDLAEFVLSL